MDIIHAIIVWHEVRIKISKYTIFDLYFEICICKNIFKGSTDHIKFRPCSFQHSKRTRESYREYSLNGLPNLPYFGIKGPTLISNKVHFPDGVPLDRMHLIDLGQFKRMIIMYFDSANKFEKFYLGFN